MANTHIEILQDGTSRTQDASGTYTLAGGKVSRLSHTALGRTVENRTEHSADDYEQRRKRLDEKRNFKNGDKTLTGAVRTADTVENPAWGID